MPSRLHPTMDREAAFAQSLLTFKNWHLSLGCPRCRVLRRVEVVHLLRLYGPGRHLGDLFRRLRCQDCGSEPNRATLKEGWAAGREAYEIPLLP